MKKGAKSLLKNSKENSLMTMLSDGPEVEMFLMESYLNVMDIPLLEDTENSDKNSHTPKLSEIYLNITKSLLPSKCGKSILGTEMKLSESLLTENLPSVLLNLWEPGEDNTNVDLLPSKMKPVMLLSKYPTSETVSKLP